MQIRPFRLNLNCACVKEEIFGSTYRDNEDHLSDFVNLCTEIGALKVNLGLPRATAPNVT